MMLRSFSSASYLALALSVAACFFGCSPAPQAQPPTPPDVSKYASPEYIVPSPDSATLYATAATAQRIDMIDTATKTVRGSFPVAVDDIPQNPTGIAVARDGTVYVTAGVAPGFLLAFDASGKRKASLAVGHSPQAPVISADGRTAYILNRFANTVTVVDTSAMKILKTIGVPREPVSAALGAGGKLLFVGNHLPYMAATNDIVATAVSVIDTATFATRNVILPNGSTGLRGVAASPDGKFIYATHTLGRYQLPTTQLERGWMNTADLSILNGETGEFVNTVMLDDVDLGAANPWGMTVSPDGKYLFVAHAGTHEVSIIDRTMLHDRLDRAARGERVTDVATSPEYVQMDLSFLTPARRRIKLPGNGSRGIALVGTTIYVAQYFSDAIYYFTITDSLPDPIAIAVAPEQDITLDRVRRGEMIYNDAAFCFQQWQSCASCHPDGRADALNWDLLNDGIGNPKQTKSEIYSAWTPPTMITGIRKDMATCNRAGLTHIQFVVRPDEDGMCFDAYCTAMKPVPSPYLVNGELSARAKKGEILFKKAKCAVCHTPDEKGPNGEALFTDKKLYNLGLGTDSEENRDFDTPTLVEVWRTAPYLYDGRALTMEDVLTRCNPEDRHGETKHLSAEEIKCLAEYVLSL